MVGGAGGRQGVGGPWEETSSSAAVVVVAVAGA